MTIKIGRAGIIGRFKPVHLSSAKILQAVCKSSDEVLIGLGSCNKYNLRNPFTVEESEEMVKIALKDFDNYQIIQVPDFGHIYEYRDGTKWRDHVLETFGGLDYFVVGNPYVYNLFEGYYPRIHPFDLMESKSKKHFKGTGVRLEMARGRNWKKMVPEDIANYLVEKGLVERFRREFGEETIATFSGRDFRRETAEAEIKSVQDH